MYSFPCFSKKTGCTFLFGIIEDEYENTDTKSKEEVALESEESVEEEGKIEMVCYRLNLLIQM